MNQSLKSVLKKAFQYLFQGIVVIAPIAITIYFVFWLFFTIDSLLPNLYSKFGTVPEETHIPGVGFLVIVILLMLIGRASSTFVFGHMLDFLGSLLEKTPGIKLIYSSVKDFLKAFSGSQKKFDKPVMVNVDSENVWRIGFVTQTDANNFGFANHVVVYVPFSYAISGVTYLVPKEKIKFLAEEIHSTDAMKFVISGGVTEMENKN
ncbi:MAG: DUF502 domain-containing protein [Arachidicoccus sp.]|nr:DUF502 domain-containing protein [Arachidicoccus sp.]